MQIPLRDSFDSSDEFTVDTFLPTLYSSSEHAIPEEGEDEEDEAWDASIVCSSQMHERQQTPPSPQSPGSPQSREKKDSEGGVGSSSAAAARSRANADSDSIRRFYRPPKIIVDKAFCSDKETSPGGRTSPGLSPYSGRFSPWSERSHDRATRMASNKTTFGSPQVVQTEQIEKGSLQNASAVVLKPAIMVPLEMEDNKDVAQCPLNGFTLDNRVGPTFRRRGGSLSWSMGFNILGDWNTEVASFYTKCNDWEATMLMLNVTCGPNAYILSSSLTEAGMVPALIMMSFMAASYMFLLLRVIDVPQLEGCDMETCHDMVRKLAHPRLYHISCVIIVCRILFLCGSLFHGVEYFAVKLLPTHASKEWSFTLRILVLAFLTYTSTFWSSPRSIRLNSKVGFYAMVVAFVLISACLVWKAFVHPIDVNRPMFGPRETWVGALRKANYAFGGVSFLPHIVGDMQRPENTQKIVRKSVFMLFCIYTAIFLLGFVFLGTAGGGSKLMSAPMLEKIEFAHPSSSYVRITCYIVRVCFVMKCLTSYTIILWPLSRELHQIIGMDRSPPLTLALPWAQRQNQRAKLAMRFVLVMVSTMVFTHGWGYLKRPQVLGNENCAVLIGAPHALVEYLIFPACVIAALVSARRRFSVEEDTDNPTQENEFFGKRRRHFAFTIFVLSCIIIIGLFALIAGAINFGDRYIHSSKK